MSDNEAAMRAHAATTPMPEFDDGPPGPWAVERWFYDKTEAGKALLEARRAMKAADAPFPLWFYMAPGAQD